MVLKKKAETTSEPNRGFIPDTKKKSAFVTFLVNLCCVCCVHEEDEDARARLESKTRKTRQKRGLTKKRRQKAPKSEISDGEDDYAHANKCRSSLPSDEDDQVQQDLASSTSDHHKPDDNKQVEEKQHQSLSLSPDNSVQNLQSPEPATATKDALPDLEILDTDNPSTTYTFSEDEAVDSSVESKSSQSHASLSDDDAPTTDTISEDSEEMADCQHLPGKSSQPLQDSRIDDDAPTTDTISEAKSLHDGVISSTESCSSLDSTRFGVEDESGPDSMGFLNLSDESSHSLSSDVVAINDVSFGAQLHPVYSNGEPGGYDDFDRQYDGDDHASFADYEDEDACSVFSLGRRCSPMYSFSAHLSPGECVQVPRNMSPGEFLAFGARQFSYSNGDPGGRGFDISPCDRDAPFADCAEEDACSVFSLDRRSPMYSFSHLRISIPIGNMIQPAGSSLTNKECAFETQAVPRITTTCNPAILPVAMVTSQVTSASQTTSILPLNLTVKSNERMTKLFRTLRRLDGFPQHRKKFTKDAKKRWADKRQALFQRRRIERTGRLAEKRRFRAIQLSGPDVVPGCGKHALGCRVIDGRALRAVRNPNNAAPINLGKGSTCSVDLVRHEETGCILAAKTIYTESLERGHKLLEKEITALKAVEGHDAFPKLGGIIKQRNGVAIAMEFIGNWDTFETTPLFLQLCTKKDQVSRSHWLMILKDIGNGLHALHCRGYLHADLHECNVLIHTPPDSDRPKAKIIDLGYAVRRDKPVGLGDLKSHEKISTYIRCRHLAPELVEGESFYSVQTDVFAYGRIIKDVALALDIDKLSSLGDQCTERNPMLRCDIQHVLGVIDTLLGIGSGG